MWIETLTDFLYKVTEGDGRVVDVRWIAFPLSLLFTWVLGWRETCSYTPESTHTFMIKTVIIVPNAQASLEGPLVTNITSETPAATGIAGMGVQPQSDWHWHG